MVRRSFLDWLNDIRRRIADAIGGAVASPA
jgi:hypothetical protein